MSTAARAKRKQGKNGKRRPGNGAEQGGAVGPTGDTNVAKTVTVSVGSLGQFQVFLEVPDGEPVSFRITRTDTSLTVSIPPDDPTEEAPDDPTEEVTDDPTEEVPDDPTEEVPR